MKQTPSFEDNIDSHVDDEIKGCLQLERPTSFFLFAGAGSGKTRSLVTALQHLKTNNGRYFQLRGQQIAVITYTNAACDEIKQRINFDPLFEISTIHSFVWTLISNFHSDIKDWLKLNLVATIEELKSLEAKGRPGTKASIDRQNSIASKQKRLVELDSIKRFTYNPNGENTGIDSLNHSEVIKISADFLMNKPLMQKLLLSRFPILLIDESQDTSKVLMDAFLHIETENKGRFTLGLFGDTMQRIYADGKADLGQNLPNHWERPVKKLNHRCPTRVVTLINRIRAAVDGQDQTPRKDQEAGIIRLFILPNNTENRIQAEQEVIRRMAVVTDDPDWNQNDKTVKTLILEHHMAARRMGFLQMFEPLYRVDKLRTGLLDGSLSGIRLFSHLVFPIIKAKRASDEFSIAAIVKRNSPLLNKKILKALETGQVNQIKKARDAVRSLEELWANDNKPTFFDVLKTISLTGLFEVPGSLEPIVARTMDQQRTTDVELSTTATSIEVDPERDQELDAWDQFLATPFDQIEGYITYINQESGFDTHQGVKGREFPRVMVIIDDSEARGFSFSYDKLFGVKEKTKSDIDNEKSGADTSIDRTRRLLYVTCSRAEKSLAVVAYTDNPDALRDHVIKQEWFFEDEVEIMRP